MVSISPALREVCQRAGVNLGDESEAAILLALPAMVDAIAADQQKIERAKSAGLATVQEVFRHCPNPGLIRSEGAASFGAASADPNSCFDGFFPIGYAMTPATAYCVIAQNPSEYDGDCKAGFPLADSPDMALDLIEPNLPESYRIVHCIELHRVLPLLAAGKLDHLVREHQHLPFRIAHLLATTQLQQQRINKLGSMLKDTLAECELLQQLLDKNEA